MAKLNYQLKVRRDTAARWARLNPILADGEPGVDITTGVLKVGDGSTRWNSLEGFYPGNSGATPNLALTEHIHAPEPHPAYDDGPDLTLLYENAKV